jgi:IK cytokine
MGCFLWYRKTGQLSNDDFRTLLMTPRSVATTEDKKATDTKSSSGSKSTKPNKEHKPRRSSANNEWLAKLRKEEDERIAEWSKNYRDRAKERRDGMTGPLPVPDETLPTTSGYRAVAPNADPYKIAEERKKAIANSKYLGGDMEHTHLVKGLDYALLQKVRNNRRLRCISEFWVGSQ